MSLAIDVDHVHSVLVAGTWHEIADDSFFLDSYEYIWHSGRSREDWDKDPMVLHGGGHSGVCATGFSFRLPNGDTMAGPLTAIQAVIYKP